MTSSKSGTLRKLQRVIESCSGSWLSCNHFLIGLLPEDWGPVYSATKHAQIAYMRSWAVRDLDLDPEVHLYSSTEAIFQEERNFCQHGVRFNCVCPATVDTQFLKQVTPDRVYHASAHTEREEADIFIQFVRMTSFPTSCTRVRLLLLF